jgi:uncharacterized iron-regulated protein
MKKLSLFACALLLCGLARAEDAQIIDTASGERVNREQLLQVLAAQDFILLGEQHDNADHHRVRGELLADLASRSTLAVVAEHLERGHTFSANGDLQTDLTQAGFDPKGWRWPLHETLFAPIAAAKITLLGGNIPRETARSAVRQGSDALPPELAQLIKTARLSATAQAALDDDLLQSHCGQLPSSMLEGLRLAQRARDAAMFDAMRNSMGKPAVLVAGNGHVRLDYGVPNMIRSHLPHASFISVGFVEAGSDKTLSSLRQRYHYVWQLPAVESRDDPCRNFGKPTAVNGKSDPS